MAKLSFSIALNLMTQGIKKGAQEVENTFIRMKKSIMSTFGTLGVGLGIGTFARSMIEVGKNFEDGMARVRAVTNATAKDFSMMSNEAKRLGATTRYSAAEAAGALENLTRNGLTPKQATAALSKTLQLAQANAIDLAQAADLCTNTMNGFGMSVSQLGKVNDQLSATAANSATNVEQLGEAMSTAAPLANNCKIGIQETSAALGTLANVGIKGADAGTALRQFFMGLSTTTPQATKALAAYGLTINQTTLAQEGLQKTLQKMSASGIGGDNQALAAIFGRRAFAGAATLINNYQKFADLNKTLGDSSGTTARMFEQGTGKMLNSIKSLSSAWEAFQVSIFESSEGMFTGPIDAITQFIRYATTNLADMIKEIAIIFGGAKIVSIFKEWKEASAMADSAIVQSAIKSTQIREGLERKLATERRQLEKINTQIESAEGIKRQSLVIKRNAIMTTMEQTRTQITSAQSAERVAIEKAAAVQSGDFWTKANAKILAATETVTSAMRSLWAKAGPMIVITLVTELIFKIKELYTQSQQVKEMAKQYAVEVKKATHTKEIAELERLKSIYNATTNNSKERANVENQISGILGKHLKSAKDINDAINERINLLKKAAEMEFYTNKSIQIQDRIDEIKSQYGGANPADIVKDPKKLEAYKNSSIKRKLNPFYYMGILGDISELRELQRQKKDADSKVSKLVKDGVKSSANISVETPATTTHKYTTEETKHTKTEPDDVRELKQLRESYREQRAEIANRKENSKLTGMTEADYLRSLKDLITNTYINIKSSKYASVKSSEFAKSIEKLVNDLPSDDMIQFAEITDKVSKAELQYEKDIDVGIKNADEVSKAMHELYKEAIAKASTLDGLSSVQKNMIERWKQQGILLEGVTAIGKAAEHNASIPNSTRDKTFDYKKTKKERLELDLEYTQKQLDSLKEIAKDSLRDLSTEIANKMKSVNSLSKALKLEEFKEDIKEAKKDLVDNFFGAFGQINNIKQSFQQLSETMSSPDTDGWDKFISVLTTLESTVNAIVGVYEAFQAIQTAINILTGANAAIATEQAVANTTNAAATTATAGAQSAQTSTTVAATVANKAAAVAAEQLAASNIFLAHSLIPFAGVGIASGMVGAMEGVLTTVKAKSLATAAFAHGGIVKGLPSDQSVAKVSDGEIIMNGTQQAHLWNAIRTGNFGGGGFPSRIELVASGRDLKAVIKNQDNKMNKV